MNRPVSDTIPGRFTTALFEDRLHTVSVTDEPLTAHVEVALELAGEQT